MCWPSMRPATECRCPCSGRLPLRRLAIRVRSMWLDTQQQLPVSVLDYFFLKEIHKIKKQKNISRQCNSTHSHRLASGWRATGHVLAGLSDHFAAFHNGRPNRADRFPGAQRAHNGSPDFQFIDRSIAVSYLPFNVYHNFIFDYEVKIFDTKKTKINQSTCSQHATNLRLTFKLLIELILSGNSRRLKIWLKPGSKAIRWKYANVRLSGGCGSGSGKISAATSSNDFVL